MMKYLIKKDKSEKSTANSSSSTEKFVKNPQHQSTVIIKLEEEDPPENFNKIPPNVKVKQENDEVLLQSHATNSSINHSTNSAKTVKEDPDRHHLLILSTQPPAKKIKIEQKSTKYKRIKRGEFHHCDECDEKFTNKIHFVKHKIHKHPKVYECKRCDIKFRGPGFLKRHKCNICEICNKKCFSRNEFEEHLRSHRDVLKVDLLSCDLCGKKIIRKHDMMSHMMRFHMEVKNKFECDLCGVQFVKKDFISMHMSSVHKPLVKCKICYKKMKSINLAYHLKDVHSDERNFQCQKCEKSFKMKKNLQIHMRFHDKPFVCKICNKRYQMKSGLTEHLKWHSDKDIFKCKLCDKQFDRLAHLKVHGRSHARDVYECNDCDYKINSKLRFENHRKIHGKNKLKIHRNKNLRECKFCLETFLKETLKTHIRDVHQFTRFQCDFCEIICKSKKSMETHILSFHHSSEYVRALHKKGKKSRKCSVRVKKLTQDEINALTAAF